MTSDDDVNDLAEAIIDERRSLSLVWLIPLVAIAAAAWLGYRTYTQQGPLVTISFQTAEGLEAGATKVRYKDVDIGRVETIELSEDLSTVRVHARLSHTVAGSLTESTRFWVVRPRFSGGQISGLNTLVGGAYIAADLAQTGDSRWEFEGLESPPLVAAADVGSTFTLRADSLGSLSVGSPVSYRDIEVGRVVSYEIIEPTGVEIKVFVNAPHQQKVLTNTRFWNASGVGLTLDANGLRIDTESMAALLLGGIAFGNPIGEPRAQPVGTDQVFTLYASQEESKKPSYGRRQLWRLEFSGSVRGLNVGAPVEFRGIRVGEVSDIRLELDEQSLQTRIPVTVNIEPQRLGLSASATEQQVTPAEREYWNQLVAKGLRGQLRTGNLITGALFVDLDYYPDDKKREIDWKGRIAKLPTVPTPLDELLGLVSRLSDLPLEQMVEGFNTSLVGLRKTLDQATASFKRLDQNAIPALSRTLQQTEQTLAAAEKVLTPGSPLQSEAQRVLQELATTARSLRIMADYLERHPEALIRGKGGNNQ